MKHILTIAGSDSSGGAGIQADLKTMCALGAYGMSVITAVTAQNTRGVYAIQTLEASIVRAQLDAVFEDIAVHAVKIGMVSDAALIQAIEQGLRAHGARNIVFDPVMVSTSGSRLLQADAVEALRALVGIADIVTPNLPEAEILSGMPIRSRADREAAAARIRAGGARFVLIKGGHSADAADDLLLCEGEALWFSAPRVDSRNTHGTGCTLSAAIACGLGEGLDMREAVGRAKAYVTQAIRDGLDIGGGAGPLGHLSALYRRAGIGEGGSI